MTDPYRKVVPEHELKLLTTSDAPADPDAQPVDLDELIAAIPPSRKKRPSQPFTFYANQDDLTFLQSCYPGTTMTDIVRDACKLYLRSLS